MDFAHLHVIAGVDEAGVGVDGQALDGDHAGHEAGHERRALTDGLGDVGREHGHHEVHGDAADDLQHGGEAVVVGGGGVEARDAPQERDGGEHATGDDEHQHVADAVHEVLVDDVPHGLLLVRGAVGELGLRALGSGGVALGGQGAIDQRTGGLHGECLGDAHHDLGLALKALGLHILVRGDDHGLGSDDLCFGELVLDADLAMRLDLDGETALGGSLLKRLLCHEGMRDAGRTTGGRDDVVRLGHAFTFPFRDLLTPPRGQSMKRIPCCVENVK